MCVGMCVLERNQGGVPIQLEDAGMWCRGSGPAPPPIALLLWDLESTAQDLGPRQDYSIPAWLIGRIKGDVFIVQGLEKEERALQIRGVVTSVFWKT